MNGLKERFGEAELLKGITIKTRIGIMSRRGI
jgi:hypothetical protein